MQYETCENYCTHRIEHDGSRTLLANFMAVITRETRYVDGRNSTTVLTIQGKNANETLPPVEVTTDEFPAMKWVLQAWGTTAVIVPGQGAKDDLRTQIQLSSKPEKRTIYTHIGWTMINNQPAYLHAAGAITPRGNDPDVRVQLPPQLSRYRLHLNGQTPHAVKATLALTQLASPEITYPLLAATIAPLHGPVDFATHVSGRTGTFKSEITSLFQAHYGPEMDARHLPGSWSSTANALEAEAYRVANAVFAVDDFVPTGTSWQIRQYQKTADQLIRAQGNQAGRSRLSDTSNLQTTMYPRGLIMSTGEDTPQGHSIRARMLIIELSPGDVTPQKLTEAQRARGLYSSTTAAYVHHLASNPLQIEARANSIRDQILDIGHARTPAMIARLIASFNEFLGWARKAGHIDDQTERKHRQAATIAITEAGNRQSQYLEESDPCDAFCEALRNLLQGNQAHMRTTNGGIPSSPTLLGWTEETMEGEVPRYRSHGRCIGWVNWNQDEMYLDAAIAYNELRKSAGLAWTKQTLFKRLKEAGAITRSDDTRQRNTVRITAEGHPRQVLVLQLSTVLQTQEVPQ